MAAFGFKKQFVHPICLGLGLPVPAGFEWGGSDPLPVPKLQTIRAPRKDGRTAKPGETCHLFYAMRTRQCLRIGLGRCLGSQAVFMHFPKVGDMRIALDGEVLVGDALLGFARADGFRDLDEMARFWHSVNSVRDSWSGNITRWEPAES
jgi:hypothetical protein